MPPPRLLLVALMLMLAGWTGVVVAAPSPEAQTRAAKWVARLCPQFDRASLPALAAVFQRTMDKRVRNGRTQVQPIQRIAAAAEITTLAEYCRRPDVRVVRALAPAAGVKTPDFVVEQDGVGPVCVEVVSVTGRYPRPWQHRASGKSRIGARAPTEEQIASAIERKINSGQLSSPSCPNGGVIALHVAARKASSWPKIAAAVGDRADALAGAAHVRSVEVRSGGERVDVPRSAATGVFEVEVRADLRPGYQKAVGPMRDALPVNDQGGAGGAPLTAPGLPPRGGALVRQLSPGGPGATGGIDFSSLELRYVADRGGGGIRYAFRGRPGASDPALGLQTTQDSSDAFFVWLALSPQRFWVNLNPTEPDRVIDSVFARSDAGRVLLEADLALKKVVAPLVRPDTPGGGQFWRELEALYGARPDLACFSVRQWIVPERATVYQTRDELFILDAPLTVKMESEFVGGFPEGGCPQGNEAFENLKEEIYRRLILPAVIEAVNTAPEFAALRRVYCSRIAAEWFRRRHADDRSALGRIAGSDDIGSWPAVPAWNPADVFSRYLQSVRDGEWTVDRSVRVNGQEIVLTTVYGGVDFSRTPRTKVTRRSFHRKWPKLAHAVERSMRRPAVDAERGEVWLGGGSG